MKLSTILLPLALVLGLASATGVEKDASLKAAIRRKRRLLRGRLEDVAHNEQDVSTLSKHHIAISPFDTFEPMYCTVLWSSG